MRCNVDILTRTVQGKLKLDKKALRFGGISRKESRKKCTWGHESFPVAGRRAKKVNAFRNFALTRSFHNTGKCEANIAFVGLGNMGGFMAENLVRKKEHCVKAFDISSENLDRAEAAGCTRTSSPADAACDADFVITMLPSNDHVEKVYLGEDGILSTAKSGTFCIDSSTVDPAISRKVGEKLSKEKGVSFVDAPVSGGVGGAKAGTLTFMVGGSDEEFARATPILKGMGENLVHCGKLGSGEVAKLCNNLVLAISMIGVSEAMNIGLKLGIDKKRLADILNTSSARCWSSDTYNPVPGVMDNVPSSNYYEGGFGTDLMLKDLGLAADAAKAAKAPIPLGSAAQQFYQQVSVNGLGGKDFSVAYKFLQGGDQQHKSS